MRQQLFRRGLILLLLMSPGCDESLPERDQPQRYLRATLAISEGTVVFFPGETVSSLLPGSFLLGLENLYDEALQDSSLVRADVEVWLKNLPGERAVVRAGQSSLVNYGIVQGGVATLPPGVTVQLLKQWNHRTGQGKPFWCFSTMTVGYTPRGEKYYTSDTLQFAARATYQLFKYVQPEKTNEIEFTLRYRIFVIDTLPPCD